MKWANQGNRRSICRALIPSNCLSVSALGWYSWRIHGIQIGRIAFSRTDHGYGQSTHRNGGQAARLE
jgi:hypothetical protein